MISPFTESAIEKATIVWLKELSYDYVLGSEITFDGAVCTQASLREGSSMLGRSEVRNVEEEF